MTVRSAALAAGVLALTAAVTVSCERERRRFHELPAAANRETAVRLTTLQPGAPQQESPVMGPYDDNAWGLGEGKRLYSAYNCSGCHAVQGGGAIGPALSDDTWIYGSEPDQIYSTISQGRPDGMPSFGGHIPAQQIWQLTAYVRSLSGLVPKDAATGRNDDQMSALPENRQPAKTPVQTGHR
jgi:cytochrome c oxidase cbb3-type subunit 3